jgi:hypothetical protein
MPPRSADAQVPAPESNAVQTATSMGAQAALGWVDDHAASDDPIVRNAQRPLQSNPLAPSAFVFSRQVITVPLLGTYADAATLREVSISMISWPTNASCLPRRTPSAVVLRLSLQRAHHPRQHRESLADLARAPASFRRSPSSSLPFQAPFGAANCQTGDISATRSKRNKARISFSHTPSFLRSTANSPDGIMAVCPSLHHALAMAGPRHDRDRS